MDYIQNLEKRKEEVVRSIEEQGKLTEELKQIKAQKLQEWKIYIVHINKKEEQRLR